MVVGVRVNGVINSSARANRPLTYESLQERELKHWCNQDKSILNGARNSTMANHEWVIEWINHLLTQSKLLLCYVHDPHRFKDDSGLFQCFKMFIVILVLI